MASVDPDPMNDPARLAADFDTVLSRLEAARTFGKAMQQQQLMARAKKLLRTPEGIHHLYEFAPRFDAGGVFAGGDWVDPLALQPALVSGTLRAGGINATLECLSELRMLAIAEGQVESDRVTAVEAGEFLRQVLAANLDLVFPVASELSRAQDIADNERIQNLFVFILNRLGTGAILAEVVDEIERVLLQRPIMVQRAEALLRSAARAIDETAADDETVGAARNMIAALDGPSALAQSCEPAAYAAALATCDYTALAAEAEVFGQAMHNTGLVSFQHAALLRHLVETARDLLPDALALDRVGRASFENFWPLVCDIVRFAIHPETARSIYGLSRVLNTGALFARPVAPGLRRLTVLTINDEVAAELREGSEWQAPPSANALLLAGTLSVLGQPRGVDQGHNPTCQAARAISLWAQNDVGFLLDLIASAASDDDLAMHFEGQPIHSSELSTGLAKTLHTELDPVSLLLTPHLDRIYMEMGRRTIGRLGDGHRWVNPELHGWWVDRGFAGLINLASSAIENCDGFIRDFHAAYHPVYNGGRDLVYAQPCGVATTDHSGGFVGWHAISIQRVALDPDGAWRVYFYNPNRGKGQNWGQGVVTSTHDCGEWEGESSLPFEQFLSRLYVFHYNPREVGDPALVPADTVTAVRAAIAASWGASFSWSDMS